MIKYKRLNAVEREEISRMLALKYSFQFIAKTLGRSVSAISREVSSGSCNQYTYRAAKAQNRAVRNSSKRRGGQYVFDSNVKLKRYVYRHLRLKWSPTQIAQTLKMDYPTDIAMRTSPESIYTYLYVLPRGTLKKELLACLRQNRKHRHKQRRGAQAKRDLADMLSIEERPQEVEGRIVPGHWEGDLIVGKNNRSALGTLVERTTRTIILIPIKNRNLKHKT